MSKNKRVLYNLIIKNFFRLITVILCFFYLLEHDVTHIVGAIVFLLTSLGVDIVFKLINVKYFLFVGFFSSFYFRNNNRYRRNFGT